MGRKSLSALVQDPGVAADEDECEASLQVPRRVVDVSGEGPGRFAGRAKPQARIRENRLDLTVKGVGGAAPLAAARNRVLNRFYAIRLAALMSALM